MPHDSGDTVLWINTHGGIQVLADEATTSPKPDRPIAGMLFQDIGKIAPALAKTELLRRRGAYVPYWHRFARTLGYALHSRKASER
jgi:hypothetical protein